MLKRSAPTAVLAAAALVLGASPAFAHLDRGAHGSLMAGLSHPLFGADHVLAMVAVGLWAAQIGGRAVFAVPLAFVGTMASGFLLGLSGLVALPFVEPAILASVVVLGLLVASAAKLPLWPSTAIVGSFALFHGFAHASELGKAGASSFAAGFVVSTIVLHLIGIATGRLFGAGTGSAVTRLAGAATAAAGLSLIFG